MATDKKYHIGKDGTPKVCTAKGECKLGGEHFDNIEAAQKYADELNEKNMKALQTLRIPLLTFRTLLEGSLFFSFFKYKSLLYCFSCNLFCFYVCELTFCDAYKSLILLLLICLFLFLFSFFLFFLCFYLYILYHFFVILSTLEKVK